MIHIGGRQEERTGQQESDTTNKLQSIMSANWQPQIPVQEIKGGPIEGGPDGVKGSENEAHGGKRKKVVIVGLGMVGISFMFVFAPPSGRPLMDSID